MKKVTTENKIIMAANKLFTQKGYSATTTRDIAKEAGTNLALINYHFGSKENLYKKVVREKLMILIGAMGPILSDEEISLEEKIESIVGNYTTLLLENEELPIFILSELTVNKEFFVDITQNTRQLAQPVIDKQLNERELDLSAVDLIINTLSLTMFPFVAKPLITTAGLIKEEGFIDFVTERKKKILEWILKTTK